MYLLRPWELYTLFKVTEMNQDRSRIPREASWLRHYCVHGKKNTHKDHFLSPVPQSQLNVHVWLLGPHKLYNEQKPWSLRRRNGSGGHCFNSKWPLGSQLLLLFRYFSFPHQKDDCYSSFHFKYKYFRMEACQTLAQLRLRAFSGENHSL